MALDTNAVMAQSVCINSCIPQGMQLAVLIYLLNQMSESGISVSVGSGDTCSDPDINTNALALAANATRRSAKIRNLSDEIMYVRLGAGCGAMIGTYWEIIPAAQSVDDWDSSYYLDIENYTGIITCAGNNLRYIATEIYES